MAVTSNSVVEFSQHAVTAGRLPRMINEAGAGLIAQVYPVAILLVVLESHRSTAGTNVKNRWGVTWFIFTTLLTAVTVVISAWAVALCVVSVATGNALTAGADLVVALSGVGLVVCAVTLAFDLLLESRLQKSVRWRDVFRADLTHADAFSRARSQAAQGLLLVT
jgi:hypothetical protein